MANPNYRPRGEPVKPNKDERAYKEWCLAHDHCMACGVPAHRSAWPHLSTHHIIKTGRSHDETNLIRLCYRDHELAEGRNWVEGGVRLAVFPVGMVLALKLVREPAQFDAARLAALRMKNLPDMVPVPDWLEAQFRRWRPRDAARFYHGPQQLRSLLDSRGASHVAVAGSDGSEGRDGGRAAGADGADRGPDAPGAAARP